MALVFTRLENNDTLGSRKAVMATATFDASYAAGGLDVVVPARSIGINRVIQIIALDSCTTTGHTVRYDRTAKKLLAFNTDRAVAAAQGGVEVPAATNLASAALTVLVVGD